MATSTFTISPWVEALKHTLIYRGSSGTLRCLPKASRLKAMKLAVNSTSTSTTPTLSCSIMSPTRLLTSRSALLHDLMFLISSSDSRAVSVRGSVARQTTAKPKGRSLRRAPLCLSYDENQRDGNEQE